MVVKPPPYAVLAGDYLLPKPISGHPALELCNTLAGWDEPPDTRHEWLTSYGHLLAWAEFTGLVGAATRPPHEEAVLAEVHELRAAAYQVLRHGEASAFDRVAAFADEANRLRRLVPVGSANTGGGAAFVLPASQDPRLPRHAAALAVADLLGRPERATIRACPGAGCGWLFLDPRGRRVWCSMAACGNRAKVRAHAARRRSVS